MIFFKKLPHLPVTRKLAEKQRSPWPRLALQLAASLFFCSLSPNTRVSALETWGKLDASNWTCGKLRLAKLVNATLIIDAHNRLKKNTRVGEMEQSSHGNLQEMQAANWPTSNESGSQVIASIKIPLRWTPRETRIAFCCNSRMHYQSTSSSNSSTSPQSEKWAVCNAWKRSCPQKRGFYSLFFICLPFIAVGSN